MISSVLTWTDIIYVPDQQEVDSGAEEGYHADHAGVERIACVDGVSEVLELNSITLRFMKFEIRS